MAGYGGGGFAKPGTRVENVQTDTSQWKTYIIQATVLAIILDLALLAMVIILLFVGWPVLAIASIPIAIFGASATKKVLEYLSKCAVSYDGYTKLKIGFVVSIIASDVFFVTGWWDWLIAKDTMQLLVVETLTPVFSIHWLIYILLIGLWFYAAIQKKGFITFVFILASLITWTVAMVNYTVNFAIIWSRMRYVSAMMLVPWVASSIVLAFAMVKELIAPNLNFILDTIPWADYKEAGGIVGLLFPKLVEWKEKLDSRVAFNISVNGRKNSHGKPTQQKRRTLFAPASNADGLANFAIAILSGQASFSERGNETQKGATDYGFTQGEYKELRETAYNLGMLDKKGNQYTPNEYMIETLEQIIERVLGIEFVPHPTP